MEWSLRKRDAPFPDVRIILTPKSPSIRALEQHPIWKLFLDNVVDYAIFLLDPSGRVASWNKGAQRLKGYHPEEIVGQPFTWFYTPPDLRRGLPGDLLTEAAANGSCQHEGWRVRKDGSRFWALVSITAISDEAGEVLAYAKITRDLTEHHNKLRQMKRIELSLVRSQTELRTLAHRLLSLQEEERKRIGRDLHDSFAQSIALVGMRLEELQRDPALAGRAIRQELGKLHNQITDVALQIRRISHGLHPVVLEHLGLVKAIKQHLETVGHGQSFTVAFHHRQVPRLVPQKIALCLYRIVQEWLGNIARHAACSKVNVTLWGGAGGLRLRIHDDGRGFNPASIRKAGRGMGLVSMEERVRHVGGTLHVRSRPGEGASLEAFVPVRDRSDGQLRATRPISGRPGGWDGA